LGAAAFFLWTGWYRGRSLPDPSELQPATEQQQILTAIAINRLRAVFSSAACQSIYDEASQAFRSQTELDWLYQCNQLREHLREWQRFDIESTTTYGAPKQFVWVEGSAVFAKASPQLSITWLMDEGGIQLESLSLRESGTWKRIPEVQPGFLMDPPPPLASTHLPGWYN